MYLVIALDAIALRGDVVELKHFLWCRFVQEVNESGNCLLL
jgi:hypothetical protein